MGEGTAKAPSVTGGWAHRGGIFLLFVATSLGEVVQHRY